MSGQSNQDGKRYIIFNVKSGFTVRFFLFNIMDFGYNMLMNHNLRRGIILGLLYLAGFIILANTSPQKLPIASLILPFVYIFGLVFFTVLFIASLVGKKSSSRLLAGVVSTFVVLLLVLGSMHQLNAKDVLLSLVITVVLSWYIVKIRN